MNNFDKKVQSRWNNSQIFACEGVVYGDGNITLNQSYYVKNPNDDTSEYFISPLTDTNIKGVEKYNNDAWLDIFIYPNSFIHDNQRIVFGAGCMGSEGFVASTTLDNKLNWSVYFESTNPINKAEVTKNKLICYGDTGYEVEINLDALHEMKLSWSGWI